MQGRCLIILKLWQVGFIKEGQSRLWRSITRLIWQIRLLLVTILTILDMLEAVGEAYVMANAPQEVKEQVGHVTASHNHDGIALVLENLAIVVSNNKSIKTTCGWFFKFV